MTEHASAARGTPDELVPIQTVAQQLGVNASTLRYYEKRGLVEPVARDGGRRWYGQREIRRVAIILFWQRGGQMSLDTIAELLDRSAPGGKWQDTVARHLADLRERIEQMQQVEAFVAQSLECAHHECLDECPDYEELIWQAHDRQRGPEDQPIGRYPIPATSSVASSRS